MAERKPSHGWKEKLVSNHGDDLENALRVKIYFFFDAFFERHTSLVIKINLSIRSRSFERNSRSAVRRLERERGRLAEMLF